MYAQDKIFEAGSLPESWLDVNPRANYSAGDFFRPELTQVSLRGLKLIDAVTLRGNAYFRRDATQQFNVNAGDPNTRAFVTNTSAGLTGEAGTATHLLRIPIAVTLGGELSRSRVAYRVYDEPNASAPTLPDDCDPSTATCEYARVDGTDAALYAQLVATPTERVAITASLRGDYVSVPFRDLLDPDNSGTSDYWHATPRLAASYALATGTSLYASVGSGFRAPAALELACASPQAPCPLPFSLGADPPLKPVVAWSSEAGLKWNSTAGDALVTDVFNTSVHDDILFVSSRLSAGYFQNVARTRRRGAELSASSRQFGMLSLAASYAYLRATYESAGKLLVSVGDRYGARRRPVSAHAKSRRERVTESRPHRSVRSRSREICRGNTSRRSSCVVTTPTPLRRSRLTGSPRFMSAPDTRDSASTHTSTISSIGVMCSSVCIPRTRCCIRGTSSFRTIASSDSSRPATRGASP